MASEYYNYYHPATNNYYGNGDGNSSRSWDSCGSSQSPPLHLVFFLSVLLLFVGLSWYMSYESALESIFDQLKVALLLVPVLLLLALHCLSGVDRRWVPFLVPFPEERDAFYRAGGSPWGVALVLVLLIFMLSYRASFQERWFPLISR